MNTKKDKYKSTYTHTTLRIITSNLVKNTPKLMRETVKVGRGGNKGHI